MGIFAEAARECGFIDEIYDAFVRLDEIVDAGEDSSEYDDYLWETYPDEFQRVNDYVDGYNNGYMKRR